MTRLETSILAQDYTFHQKINDTAKWISTELYNRNVERLQRNLEQYGVEVEKILDDSLIGVSLNDYCKVIDVANNLDSGKIISLLELEKVAKVTEIVSSSKTPLILTLEKSSLLC